MEFFSNLKTSLFVYGGYILLFFHFECFGSYDDVAQSCVDGKTHKLKYHFEKLILEEKKSKERQILRIKPVKELEDISRLSSDKNLLDDKRKKELWGISDEEYWGNSDEVYLELGSTPRGCEKLSVDKGPSPFFFDNPMATYEDIRNQWEDNILLSIDYLFKLLEEDIICLSKDYFYDSLIKNASKMWFSQNGWETICIDPNGKSNNSHYMRYEDNQREIVLSSENNRNKPGNKSTGVYTDIAIHEAAHAILDLICPKLFSQINIHTGAIHEAFSNWMIVSSKLDQMDFCQYVYLENLCYSEVPIFVGKIAQEFGANFKDKNALRFMKEDVHISYANGDVRAASLVLTGVWWNILKGAHTELIKKVKMDFKKGVNKKKGDVYTSLPAKMIYDLNVHFRRILIEAILRARAEESTGTFEDLGRFMYNVVSNRQDTFDPITQISWGNLIEEEFRKRGIFLELRKAPGRKVMRLTNHFEQLINEEKRSKKKQKSRERGKSYYKNQSTKTTRNLFEEERIIAKSGSKSICQTLPQRLHSQYDPIVFNELIKEKVESRNFFQQKKLSHSSFFKISIQKIEESEQKIEDSKRSFIEVLSLLR